ncbi:unnamed protein product [marine sediment metagenome]|uniref:Uncharacterized protein n=1 Tax=marine sediment metagenome TaxID=412755 RepID=X1G7F8_9ZZZZ
MQWDKLPHRAKMLLNDYESTAYSIRMDIDWLLARLESSEDIVKLLPRLEALIATLQSMKSDLEDPLSLLEEDGHPCDNCIVTRDKLDPNEHCDGCINEARLIDYVPAR